MIRDKNIDVYRGLIMMYIVGVIHTVYWLPVSENILKSLLLFEMSIVFYITGVSYTLSKSRTYLNYIVSRMTRILIPYLGFVMCILFLEYIAYILGTSIKTVGFYEFVVRTINPFTSPPVNLRFVSWHLWFIPTYILLIPIIPIMYNLFNMLNEKMKYIPLVIIGVVIIFLEGIDGLDRLKNVIFYGFWIYTGFFYSVFKNIEISSKNNIVVIIFLVSILFLLGITDRYVIDMQQNKFPPNFIFLIFNMTAFSTLFIIRKYILRLNEMKIISKYINLYSKYGFTLYLYQPFTYLLIYPIYMYLYDMSSMVIYKIILVIITIGLVMILNTVFIKPFGKLESLSIYIKKQ